MTDIRVYHAIGGVLVRKGRASIIPPAFNPRDALVLGTYRPDSTTAGIRTDVNAPPLTVVSNHSPVSGATYENLDVRNLVKPTGIGNVTYRNCIFRGDSTPPASAAGLYTLYNAHNRGFVFEDCTFAPQTPDHLWVGIVGYGFTLRRCDIYNVVDNINVFCNINGPGGAGDNSLRNGPCDVQILQSYLHDQAWYPNPIDPPVDGSHSDNIQWQSGSGLVLRGSYLTGQLAAAYQPNYYGTSHANAAMMIKPDVGLLGGAVIEQNWIGGGAYSINIAHDGTARVITDLGSISNNRFNRDQRVQGPGGDATWTIAMPADVAGTFTGNVYDDNGHAITVRKN